VPDPRVVYHIAVDASDLAKAMRAPEGLFAVPLVHLASIDGRGFCGFRIFWPRRFRKLWHQGRGRVGDDFLLFLKVPSSVAGAA
jgi:hypothetical protein